MLGDDHEFVFVIYFLCVYLYQNSVNYDRPINIVSKKKLITGAKP